MSGIVDGFSLNCYLRGNSPDGEYPQFFLAAVDEIAEIRNSSQWRPRIYLAPLEITDVIPAYTQYTTQLQTGKGSLLWGITFCIYDPARVGTLATDFRFRIADSSSGRHFQSGFENAAAYALTPAARFRPVIISPLPIPSGLLSVQITNVAATGGQCQFCFYVAEPQPVFQPKEKTQ